MPDDYTATTQTSGTVAVGGSARGDIETGGDRDWFAVELVAGRTYTIDLRGNGTGDGTLSDPYLYGIHDADGVLIAGTTNDDGGAGLNSRVTFTANETGAYYVAAGAWGTREGTYTLRVSALVSDETRAGATDLGDITDLNGPRFPDASLDGAGDRVDYFKFTLSEAKRVGLGLRQQDADADLFLEDADGNVLYSGTRDGTANEWLFTTLLAGVYYVRVEAQEAGANDFKLRYGVSAPDPATVAELEAARQEQNAGTAPAFAETSYTFALAENADGSAARVSLGTVSASDPENSTPTYSIVGGDPGGLFAIDPGTGALSYQGSGEDYESGTRSYELTVRASDGGLHNDVSVTVNLGDVAEAPAFAETSYTFALAENADGGAGGVSLGSVTATDPEDGTITYSIESGNAGGLFAIDEATGALSYRGAGEDYESGTTSYELTVRASDGTGHSDVSVSVNVTDVEEYVILEQGTNEAPQFAYASYAFSLAENADGGAGGVSLGSVTATDPENSPITYSIESGNAGGLFAIDEATGALSYRGAGEDYESGTRSYELTVRASDGAGHSDVSVSVNVTDVNEAPVFAQPSYVFDLAENAAGVSLGSVTATDPEDGTITYSIEEGDPGGLFAIDEATGALSYRGAGEDYESGTTSYDLTVRASDGGLHTDVTVNVNVTDVEEYVILAQQGTDEAPVFSQPSYAFDLAENADGALFGIAVAPVVATDPDNDRITYSIEAGDPDGLFMIDAETGLVVYLGTGEDYESGTRSYELTVRASDGGLHTDVTVNVNVTDVAEAPAFAETSYAFSLAENADGGAGGVSLGTVSASDPENGTITYSIVGGDPGGLFAIDPATGALSYQGSGEDYESGTRSYDLTVRASDGGLHSDVTVSVNVTNVEEYVILEQGTNEAPQFAYASYAFSLAENTDGGAGGFSLGSVTATDPENSSITYSIVGGDPGGLFEIDAATGELSYRGAGEDYESVTRSYDLTVRASDGALHSDVTVNVNVTDVAEAPAFGQDSYEFDLAENAGGDTIPLSLGLVQATDPENSTIIYSIESGDPGGLFEIDPATGALSYRGAGEDYESETKSYELTVRASDGGLHTDMTVNVNVTDVEEYVSLQQEASVSEPDGEDLPANVSTTGAVAVGGSARGKIEAPNDRDWFAVTLEAGKTYRIDLGSAWSAAPPLWDPYLRGIHDAEGNLIGGTTDDNSGVMYNSRVYFTATEAGTYYVAAGGQRPPGPNEFGSAYKLSVTDVTDSSGSDDFAAGTGTSGAVAVGGSATGEIEATGDSDWFAVEFETGKTYRIDLEGSGTGAGTLYNPFLLGIRDANGTYIDRTHNDDGDLGNNSRVTFTAAEAGTYYVEAGGAGWSTGTYTLSVTDVTDSVSDDFGAGTGTTGAVAVGESVTGEIEFNDDRDWFAVTLDAGRTYRIDLKGSQTSSGTLPDPYLYGIHHASGSRIAGTTNDDGGMGYNSRVTFTAEYAGTYYVAAGANGGWVGTYTLKVVDVTDRVVDVTDDFAAGTGTTGAVAVGESARGNIETERDRDWFAVTLDAGSTYRIDLEGSETSSGTVYDPYLYGIHDADGGRIAGTTNDDGGVSYNSRVTFTAEEAGTYYVEAGAYQYWVGTYTLSVEEVM